MEPGRRLFPEALQLNGTGAPTLSADFAVKWNGNSFAIQFILPVTYPDPPRMYQYKNEMHSYLKH